MVFKVLEESLEKLNEQKRFIDTIIYKESIKRDRKGFLYIHLCTHVDLESAFGDVFKTFVKFDFKNHRVSELNIRRFRNDKHLSTYTHNL